MTWVRRRDKPMVLFGRGGPALVAMPSQGKWHCAMRVVEQPSTKDERVETTRARYRASSATDRPSRATLSLCAWGALGEVQCRSFSYPGRAGCIGRQWSVVSGGLHSHASRSASLLLAPRTALLVASKSAPGNSCCAHLALCPRLA